ncbi:hypothetical protein FRC07_001897 [Ceratobasidium sp. 392]|nr:hypothetical protein FRC07_001897 [Ceratobasidium sp. 392]
MTAPISPALKTSARSAYRALFRASGATFAGDDRVLYAFREKVRNETVAGRQELDPAEYEARVQHAFEVATVLRKNIVQGAREDGDTYRLRITSDTELGSNEGVKTPYSRPARGAPRLKCGEDPNAVTPLPPKSLRGLFGAGAGSTRSYSTQAQTTDELETEYDKNRVQSLVAKLSQVNRRVAAAPTGKGKEQIVERVILEDKLSALASRIEYLSHTHTPTDGQQQAMDAFLDIVWLNPDDVGTMGTRSDPPVQMRQFVRYLHGASKAATDASSAAIRLSPELRTAIAEEMETPTPGTKDPGAHTPTDELRAIVWRMLMVKRGMQRVAAASNDTGSDMSALQGAVRRTLKNLTYAQQCLEDLEANGPRKEDAMTLLEEMERVVEGSVMLKMMRTVEKRLEQGTLWELVDKEQERRWVTVVGEDGAEERRPPKIRWPYARLRQFEEELAIPPPIGTNQHSVWCLKQLSRSRRLLKRVYKRIRRAVAMLNSMTTVFPENDKQQQTPNLLQIAKSTLTSNTSHHVDDFATALIKSAQEGGTLERGRALNDTLTETKAVESQLRQVDTLLRNFVRNQPTEEFQANKEGLKLFLDLKMEMLLAFDSIWRVSRRLKHDRTEMHKIAGKAMPRGKFARGNAPSASLHRSTDGKSAAKEDRVGELGVAKGLNKTFMPVEILSRSLSEISLSAPRRLTDKGNVEQLKKQTSVIELLDVLLGNKVQRGEPKDSGK